ncbi:MAG: T9SS type A sorting domain-containing protein [Fluviicola sp.]|nr:T9SS type A sorting domain-containing protein [Fluviicola sp.]
MKHLFLSVLLICLSQVVLSQSQPIENWCRTSHKMNELLNNPAAVQEFANDELVRQAEALNAANQPESNDTIVYVVPVVVHVLHNGGVENVSEAQIFNAIEVMTRDYRLRNADTAEIVAEFKPLAADVRMEFVLATKAPDGSCFRGYTRTISPLSYQGDDGYAQVEAIRNGNDVYQGNWPSNEYLNVFVIGNAGGAGGYTNYPNNFGGNDMTNGIWILYTQFSEIGTSSLSAGRSMTHELGHWFNLPHTWGSSNTPGLASNCSLDDGVADTPNTQGSTGGCNLNLAACAPGSITNVQNYMDYALSCQSMYTQGQRDVQRIAIQSSVGGRNNLWTAQNIIDTGADGNLYLCTAAFSADKTTICAGTQIQFTDESFNVVNGWTWSFTGGSISSSNIQNPVVTYSTPGLYEVTLSATDGTASDIEVKTNYIRVLPASNVLPFVEGFESFSTLSNIDEWEIINNEGAGFELSPTVGQASNQSARILNFGEQDGSIDELIGAPVDLTSVSGVGSMTLSFRYAYKRRSSSDADWLKVKVTNNCGDTWVTRKSMYGLILSSEEATSPFTPSSPADWATVHMTNVTSTYWVDNFRYKFEFTAGGGNNFYLDNINLYTGSPSDNLVVGINEQNEFSQLTMFPNPVEKELNIRFDVQANAKTIIAITDISGKAIQSHLINAITGSNLVSIDTQSMRAGIYFMTIKMNGASKTKKFIVK